jgi:hypothetical protein
MPKVVITMPAYRAETTSNAVADIPGGIADRLLLVEMRIPTTVSNWHGRSASTFTSENLG